MAHEALLSRWPRARDIVNANRGFLETRARLRPTRAVGISDNRNPELLLPPGKRLAEGEELLQSRREEVDDQIIDYIEASSRAAERKEQERDRQAERALIEAAEAARRNAWNVRLNVWSVRLNVWSVKPNTAVLRPRRRANSRADRLCGDRCDALALTAGRARFSDSKDNKQQRGTLGAKRVRDKARSAEKEAVEARDQALRNQSFRFRFFRSKPRRAAILRPRSCWRWRRFRRADLAPRGHIFLMPRPHCSTLCLVHRQTAVFKHDAGVAQAAFDRQVIASSRRPTIRPHAFGTSRLVDRLQS